MSINYRLVERIHIESPKPGFQSHTAIVHYKSGVKRSYAVLAHSPLVEQAGKAGIPITSDVPDASPIGLLAEMLGVTPNHLVGADRLNFWRNGSLNVQVQHGTRSVKLACPTAQLTDAALSQHFSTWGWTQVATGKLYFRSTPNSLVRL